MTEKIILIKENLMVSVARDTYSFVILLAAVGMGVWLDSGVLQFFGACAWLWFVVNRAINLRDKYSYTLEEAKEKLETWT